MVERHCLKVATKKPVCIIHASKQSLFSTKNTDKQGFLCVFSIIKVFQLTQLWIQALGPNSWKIHYILLLLYAKMLHFYLYMAKNTAQLLAISFCSYFQVLLKCQFVVVFCKTSGFFVPFFVSFYSGTEMGLYSHNISKSAGGAFTRKQHAIRDSLHKHYQKALPPFFTLSTFHFFYNNCFNSNDLNMKDIFAYYPHQSLLSYFSLNSKNIRHTRSDSSNKRIFSLLPTWSRSRNVIQKPAWWLPKKRCAHCFLLKWWHAIKKLRSFPPRSNICSFFTAFCC